MRREYKSSRSQYDPPAKDIDVGWWIVLVVMLILGIILFGAHSYMERRLEVEYGKGWDDCYIDYLRQVKK